MIDEILCMNMKTKKVTAFDKPVANILSYISNGKFIEIYTDKRGRKYIKKTERSWRSVYPVTVWTYCKKEYVYVHEGPRRGRYTINITGDKLYI